MSLSWNLHNLFLAVYVLCFIVLNCITYCISSFYRKKFNQTSIRFGFLLAIFFAILFIPCLFISGPNKEVCRILQTLMIIGAGSASAWNAIVLFLTMKRVRK